MRGSGEIPTMWIHTAADFDDCEESGNLNTSANLTSLKDLLPTDYHSEIPHTLDMSDEDSGVPETQLNPKDFSDQESQFDPASLSTNTQPPDMDQDPQLDDIMQNTQQSMQQEVQQKRKRGRPKKDKINIPSESPNPASSHILKDVHSNGVCRSYRGATVASNIKRNMATKEVIIKK